MINFKKVQAHCDIPCAVYDPCFNMLLYLLLDFLILLMNLNLI